MAAVTVLVAPCFIHLLIHSKSEHAHQHDVLCTLAQAAKGGPLAIAKALKGIKLKDLIPEAPAIANYTTGTYI